MEIESESYNENEERKRPGVERIYWAFSEECMHGDHGS